ncbi:hypothetical protein [Flagellimonas sp.]|uniref:hypothetical protein n=1 Tax=Flagellimonas sp. TaxID=2058762 RepID=UPI003B59D20C
MGKKNLEQLFKETFDDFNVVPDDKVWDSIEASLDKKKRKRRVIPIWWRLGGVAALLAILFYVINPLDKASDGETIITNVENNDTFNEGVSEDSNRSVQSSDVDDTQLVESSSEDSTKGDVTNSDSSITENDRDAFLNKNSSIKSEQQLVSTKAKQERESIENKNSPTVTGTNQKEQLGIGEEVVVTNNTPNKDIAIEKRETDPMELDRKNSDATSVAVVSDEKIGNNVPAEGNLQKDSSHQGKTIESVTEDEGIAQNNAENKQPDERSIFEVIEEREEEVVAESTSGKWSVGPSVAPVYFNGSGEGSPIHSNFSSNSKSGNVNLSYGLTVAYNIGKKLKVRSGVHKVNFGYDTNNVAFSSSLAVSSDEKIANIDYSQASRTIVVESQDNPTERTANDAFLELAANENPSFDGKMVQQLGYIEVPLEVNYALIDKKFGVDIIGGVSSLFLVENSVLLESEDLVTEIGEANNANSVNFSANAGVGLNYEFSPKVQLSLEPVFKYQLNTFSETAGSFRPFSVGVYSGVRFKF